MPSYQLCTDTMKSFIYFKNVHISANVYNKLCREHQSDTKLSDEFRFINFKHQKMKTRTSNKISNSLSTRSQMDF